MSQPALLVQEAKKEMFASHRILLKKRETFNIGEGRHQKPATAAKCYSLWLSSSCEHLDAHSNDSQSMSRVKTVIPLFPCLNCLYVLFPLPFCILSIAFGINYLEGCNHMLKWSLTNLDA